MAKNHPDKVLDVRVVKRHLDRGTVSEKELQSHLKNLPDLTDAYELVSLEDSEPPEGGNGEAKPS